jgi:hypothetical protein
MRRLRVLLPIALSACPLPDEDPQTTSPTATDPSGTDAGDDASSGAVSSSGAGTADDDAADAATTDPSGPGSSDGDPDTGDATAADETGGLPDGLLAQGESWPADLLRFGDDLYWVNHDGGECIRRVAIAGGAAVDVACEPDDSTMPLQVIAYGDALAVAYMSTSLGPGMGFGGVRLVDPEGGAPQTIDDGSRFKSTSGNPYCNDTLATSGSHLFWYAHELSEYPRTIVHYDGASVTAFDALSPFPYGVLATPTALYWSATEAFERLDLSALGAAPTQIGMTQGSTCGVTSTGETLYLSSRGTFVESAALFRVDSGVFTSLRTLDEVAYDLAVDDTHLYFGWGTRVDRLPLASLSDGAFETLVDGPVIGGILVDGDQLYWTDYEGGEVHVQALP